MPAEVKTLYSINALQVVECMRNLAGEIEAGKFGEHPKVICLVTDPDDTPRLFVWGELSAADTMLELKLAEKSLLDAIIHKVSIPTARA